MALRFLNGEVSELCLGKPELRWIPATAKVSDALTALKRSRDTHVSVWSCGGGNNNNNNNDSSLSSCVCVGKVSMADVILFLCEEENLVDPFKALKNTPVSDIMHKGGSTIVRPLEPNSSLLESIDCILEGAQNLIIKTKNHTISNSRNNNQFNKPQPFNCPHHNGHEYCWLTQEDVIRSLFNSIASFSPIPTNTIESLNVIDHNITTVHYNSPASSALNQLRRAVADQTSIAVVDESNRLIGEISPFTLACCDETTSAAIISLSAWDLMAYIDCGGPPEELVQTVKSKLEERNRKGILDLMDEFAAAQSNSPSSSSSYSSSCSSDEDWSVGRVRGSGRYNPLRRSEATLCSPKSSLVAVMIQALAYRVSTVWVVEEDYSVIGSVTFAGMLKVFRSFSGGRHSKPEMEHNNLFNY